MATAGNGNEFSAMWNDRYAQQEYVYGEAPNVFLENELKGLHPGKILFPAEGEGRNAVYAAINGWEVTAFDSSVVAREKAIKLSERNKVTLNYKIASMEEASFDDESFDVIALIYAHNANRATNHKRLLRWLKPGGLLLLEGFSKNQLKYTSGGPKNPDFLFSEAELASDFSSMKIISLGEFETVLNEGVFHDGLASVVRLIAIKTA